MYLQFIRNLQRWAEGSMAIHKEFGNQKSFWLAGRLNNSTQFGQRSKRYETPVVKTFIFGITHVQKLFRVQLGSNPL
jgi:hypothetical protein